MIERLKCLVGLHDFEVYERDWGPYFRTWRFCRRPFCSYYDVGRRYPGVPR